MFHGVKAIIFDLDGTVADTIWTVLEATNMVRAEEGTPLVDYEYVRAGVNFATREFVKAVLVEPERANDEAYIDKMAEAFKKFYDITYSRVQKPYDGVAEAINELKKRGYRIGMLSNKPDEYVRVLADKLFGAGVFEVASGPLYGLVKPDPKLTLDVLKRLDPILLPEECVMVGDSDIDINTARNAGMQLLTVAWGYRGRKFLEEYGAENIIDEPSEIVSCFE